jgi:hypothetical protein
VSSKKKARMEQVERWSRAVYPVILVVVLVISFGSSPESVGE